MMLLLNETAEQTCRYQHGGADKATSVAIACLYLTVGTAAFLSNLFVDYVILKFELTRVVGHFYILSLSISDLIEGGFMTVIYTIELLAGENLVVFREQTWCRFSAGCALLAILSTVYNIVLITLDRVIAIFFPFRYHQIMNERKAKIIVMCLWAYMAFWCTLPLCGWAQNTNCLRPPNTICDWGMTLDYTYFLITGTLVLLSVFVVAVLQTAMLVVAIKQMKTIQEQCKQRASIYSMQGKVTRKVSLIVLAFALTYIPWFSVVIRTVITGLGGQSYIYSCNFLIFCNSFLNPWIYATTDQAIRKRIKQCIYSLIGGKKISPLGPSSVVCQNNNINLQRESKASLCTVSIS